MVFYQNPKLVAGAIVQYRDQILLCKRAIEPRHGKWTVPAGYLENEETLVECARREAREEACVQLEQLEPYALVDIPHISQVYMIFRARLKERAFQPGSESLDVQLFARHEIPWEELAFTVVEHILQMYCRDTSNAGHYPFRHLQLDPRPDHQPW